jgi:hypothetical protein
MKMMMRVFSTSVMAGLATSIALAAGGGQRGGRGGGRGNRGDAAPSTNPSAKSLYKPTTPTTQPTSEGFITRWSILEPLPGGPITQNAFEATAHKQYFPDQMTVVPKDGDKITVDDVELTWHALDSRDFNVNLVHYANDLGISSQNALFWVVTIVNSPEQMQDVRLAIGSNDASMWWFNGQEVIGIYGDRQSVVDDGVSKRLTLKKGPNVIRAAVHNGSGQTDFCARLLDQNDEPITNFTITLSDEAAAENPGSAK